MAQSTNGAPTNDAFANARKVPRQSSWTDITSNIGATIEGDAEQALNHGGVSDASASIWYSWSSSEPATVLIDTAGSSFDTVIGVYRGTALETLEPVAQANDAGARKTAWLRFAAEPNVNYKIAIAGVPPDDQGIVQVRFAIDGQPDTTAPVVQILSPPNGSIVSDPELLLTGLAFDPGPNGSGIPEGDVHVRVESGAVILADGAATGVTNWSATVPLAEGANTIAVWAVDVAGNRSPEQRIQVFLEAPHPSNDLFAGAFLLTGTQGSLAANNSDATKELGEPAHAGNAGGKSLWYKFVPSRSGVLLVNTRGSTNSSTLQPLDTLIAVYTSAGAAAGFTNLQEVASNDDVEGGGGTSEVTLGVVAGQSYYVAVDTYDGVEGEVQLNYAFTLALVYRVQALAPIGQGSVSPASGAYPANATVSLIARPAGGWMFDHFTVNGVESTDNPKTLQVTGNLTVQAVFVPREYAEDFEGAQLKLPFETSTWFVATDPAVRFNRVLESAGNGADKLTNTVTLRIRTGGGTGAFDYGTSTETNYDRLEFYVTLPDSAAGDRPLLYGAWSGETRGRFEFFLPAGAAILQWRYSKDLALSYGRDAVFIDNLDLPDFSVNSVLSVREQTSTLQVNGEPGREYLIEGSSDLRNWATLGTARANATGKMIYTEAVKGTRRFFRFSPINNAP